MYFLGGGGEFTYKWTHPVQTHVVQSELDFSPGSLSLAQGSVLGEPGGCV